MPFVAASDGHSAFKKIQGSRHDFTNGYSDGSNGFVAVDLCSTCHASHNATKHYPLWGRPDPEGDNWLLHKSGAKDDPNPMNPQGAALGDEGFLSPEEFPGSRTAMCMSCHDGVTAISDSTYLDSEYKGNLGTDLRMMHPVGRVIVPSPNKLKQPDPESVVKMDLGGSVGCISCHSIHSAEMISYRLTVSGQYCLECHIR